MTTSSGIRVRVAGVTAGCDGGPRSGSFGSSTSWRRWPAGVVSRSRAGYWPESRLARVGEQSGLAAYAWVNRIPRAARRSRWGVS